MKYALLKYRTNNLGDEIQSLAARRFLPRVDMLMNRDMLSSPAVNEPTKIICNGWFSHKPSLFPPTNEHLMPLFVSVHLADSHGSSLEALTRPEALAYFRRFGPVGCRDHATRELLEANGVPAYFSGCLTLTTTLEGEFERTPRILLVDVPDDVASAVPDRLRHRVTRISHEYGWLPSRVLRHVHAVKQRRARQLLRIYKTAHLVITSRLHCALPCRALGTPVVFIPAELDDPRFTGLSDFLRCCTAADLVRGRFPLDWDNPGPNPGDITPVVEALERRCRQFVGSDLHGGSPAGSARAGADGRLQPTANPVA